MTQRHGSFFILAKRKKMMTKGWIQYLLTRHLYTSRTPVWCGSGPQGYKERWDNLAMVEVHCGECIVCDEANNVQPCCLILDIWPRSRAGILLLPLHLSSPLCLLRTVTGGLPGAALISVCLSFSISHPRSGESSLGPGWTGEGLDPEWKGPWLWNNQLCVVQQTSGC